MRFDKDMLYVQSGSRLWSIDVEVADSDRERKRGLMGRRRLGENEGMLFLFPDEDIVGMWMKNTRIPLDMLFIDRRGRIVNIVRNARPRSTGIITSEKPVIAVLELPGGITARRGINAGDWIIHDKFVLYGKLK